jgi:diadenosine tetraphosphatase ApaH/serine/threonine PP2A family protein phosphatase
MKALIISDIHANLTALEAVFEDAGDFDATWCLGDIVGYGPDPNECVTRIRSAPNLTCLLGNHDAAVIEDIDIGSFNIEARISVGWTQSVINPDSLKFLRSLPANAVVEGHTLAHGSPRHPIWEYLLDSRSVAENFEFFDTPFCFVGHTHLPVIYYLDGQHQLPEQIIPKPVEPFQLKPRSIINPGSVGQPRDRNPLASYAIFDTETHILENRRVAYDVQKVQERMRAVQLPYRHINRLEIGW